MDLLSSNTKNLSQCRKASIREAPFHLSFLLHIGWVLTTYKIYPYVHSFMTVRHHTLYKILYRFSDRLEIRLWK